MLHSTTTSCVVVPEYYLNQGLKSRLEALHESVAHVAVWAFRNRLTVYTQTNKPSSLTVCCSKVEPVFNPIPGRCPPSSWAETTWTSSDPKNPVVGPPRDHPLKYDRVLPRLPRPLPDDPPTNKPSSEPADGHSDRRRNRNRRPRPKVKTNGFLKAIPSPDRPHRHPCDRD